MDIGFPVCRGDSNGLVLDHASESGHRMPFEMGEVDHEVIILQMRAHNVIFYMCGVPDRYPELPFRIHDIDLGDLCKAVVSGCLHMLFGSGALAAISRVTFHDSPVDFPDELLYKLRLEIIVPTGFSGAYLHRYSAMGLMSKGLINSHKGFRRNLLCHVNL